MASQRVTGQKYAATSTQSWVAIGLCLLTLTGCEWPFSKPTSSPPVTISGQGTQSIDVPAPVILVPETAGIASNQSLLVVSGSCESDAMVHLSGDISSSDISNPSGSLSQLCVAGAFSYTIDKAVDGLYEIFASQEKSGVSSPSSSSVFWLRDTVAPAAPSLTSPGTNPFYSSVADSSLSIQGTCESSATVSLSGDATDSVTCSGGTFSFSVSQAVGSTNSFNFSIQQTDIAGNHSLATDLQWNRQDVPQTPTITIPAASPLRNNLSSIEISGACESGYTVNLSGADTQQMPCSASAYSFTVNLAVDNIYNFSVTQTNNIAQTSAPASQQWIRDTAAPAAPTVTSPGASPYLTAASNVNLVGECEPDAALTITPSVGSPVTITCPLVGMYLYPHNMAGDGTYDFTLQQVDMAGNASSVANYQVIRDTAVPPTPVIAAPVTSPFHSHQSELTISGSCIDGLLVTLSGDDSQSMTCSSSEFSFLINKPAAPGSDLNFGFSVKQTSLTGIDSGSANQAWRQDLLAPDAPTVVNPAGGFHESSGNSLVINGACESGATVVLSGDESQSILCSASSYEFTVSRSVDSTYNFSVAQIDLAGNSSSSAPVQWIRNSVAPQAPVILNPALATNHSQNPNLTVNGTCDSGNLVNLTGDLGNRNMVCTAGAFSFDLVGGSDGSYNISVTQTHADLTSAPDSILWILDRLAPNTIINSGPASHIAVTSVSVTFSSNETGVSFECKIDGGSYSPCSSPKIFNGLSNGSHTISVRAKDQAGNVDATPATVTFTVDASAPDIDWIKVPHSYTWYDDATFKWSVDDAGTTFECKRDGGSYAPCTSPKEYHNLSDGHHSFTVKATNPAGLTSTKTYTWFIND